jgi:hypothetical protein
MYLLILYLLQQIWGENLSKKSRLFLIQVYSYKFVRNVQKTAQSYEKNTLLIDLHSFFRLCK